MTLTLRPARDDHDDSHNVYHLAMLPEVREVSTRSESFTFEQHSEWWARRIKDSLILIAEVDGRFVGYVRWGKVEGKDEAEVAIAILPSEWGKGYGYAALTTSRFYLEPNVKPVALVLEGNERSARLFESAGYKRVGTEERMGKQHVRYEL